LNDHHSNDDVHIGRKSQKTSPVDANIFPAEPSSGVLAETAEKWHGIRPIQGHSAAEGALVTEKPVTAITGPQWVRALALARGLDRAHALFPEAVAAAVARGTGSLSPQPAEFSAVTEPAVTFDPATFLDDNEVPA
jgi:hypothetical protein